MIFVEKNIMSYMCVIGCTKFFLSHSQLTHVCINKIAIFRVFYKKVSIIINKDKIFIAKIQWYRTLQFCYEL